MNLDDHCWLFASPRNQWRAGHVCPAFGNEAVLKEFGEWQKHQPPVKTRRELRRGVFRPRLRRKEGPELDAREAEAIASLLHAGRTGRR